MDILENLDNHVNDYKKVKNSSFSISPKKVLQQLQSFIKQDTLFQPQEIQLYIRSTLLRIDTMIFNGIIEDEEINMLRDLREFILEFAEMFDINI